MIEAHTIDAWTRAADKQSVLYRDANILGGFAAPLFLWLAGLAVVLAATRTVERTGSRAQAVEAIVRRGLEIFILAFLFRLQAFIVSPATTSVTLFRVDILNVMGPAIVVAGSGLGARRRTAAARRGVCRAMAVAVGMLTPIVRASPLVEYAAGVGPVVHASGGRAHRVHAVAVGRVRVRGRRRRRAARDRARRARRAPAERRDWRRRRRAVALGFYTAGAAVDLRRVVVLDQLADLVRDPRSGS